MTTIRPNAAQLMLVAALTLAGPLLATAAEPATDEPSSTQAQEPSSSSAGMQRLANPASVHCGKLNGTLEIRSRPDGGQYGVCVLEDNRQCEEWALLRNECPASGVKITGYDNQAQIYCAITGGKVDVQAGTCLRADGTGCGLDENFSGSCP